MGGWCVPDIGLQLRAPSTKFQFFPSKRILMWAGGCVGRSVRWGWPGPQMPPTPFPSGVLQQTARQSPPARAFTVAKAAHTRSGGGNATQTGRQGSRSIRSNPVFCCGPCGREAQSSRRGAPPPPPLLDSPPPRPCGKEGGGG